MSKLIGYLAAVAIIVGAGALAVYLVSLAPQPERSEQPLQIPFVQSTRVIAGVGAIPCMVLELFGLVRKSKLLHRSVAGSTG